MMVTPVGSSAWFIGEGSLLIQAASTWIELGHGIAGIASSDPGISAWANEHGLTLVPPSQLRTAASAAPFDYLFSVVNLSMLAEDVLRLPTKLAVNFHDGYLPRYAGVNATVWALLAGEESHGVTWHEMTGAADEGNVLVQKAFDISPDETAFSLNAKCFTAGMETFRELAERISAGTLAPTPQNLADRSYFDFYDRPANAQVISFHESPEVVCRLVRALDFGAYPNPVGVPKILVRGGALLVAEAEALEERSGSAPGTVVTVDADSGAIVVATSGSDVRLRGLRSIDGARLAANELATWGVTPGAALESPAPEFGERLTRAYGAAARSEGAHLRLLATLSPLAFSFTGGEAGRHGVHAASVRVPEHVAARELPELTLAFAARKSGVHAFDVGYTDPALREKAELAPGLFATEVPLRIQIDANATLGAALASIQAARHKASGRFPYARDLPARQARAAGRTLSVSLVLDTPAGEHPPSADLAVHIDASAGTLELRGRADRLGAAELERFARRLELFLAHATDRDLPLARVPLVTPDEERQVREVWNATAHAVPEHTYAHSLFEAQARLTPDRPALSSRGKTLSYRELDRRANALAAKLVEQGVGPNVLVGIHVERSIDLVTAVLGVHKAGGAYVPLDTTYPADRLRFMIEDSALRLVITDRATQATLPSGDFARLVVDQGSLDAGLDAPPVTQTTGEHLAYVIYTSGSTGKPKGVLVEHRNLINFLVGMDQVIEPKQGTWLAVTSLSFDISILELYWPLAHGLHLLVHAGGVSGGKPSVRPLDMSLFYFASDEAGGSPEHYRLLFEGARFADQNGFVAVWTPERHFHAFGGLYPNPAVTSAALAMTTTKLQLRAGSCVSPLHSPLRIAEEWGMVDNLSNGRVGVSFASGWQPNDFAIRPEHFARRKEQMFEDIDTVRRLWRGERVPFKSGTGKEVMITTLPRPVQKELPIWVTAAGTPETFEAAGRIGANLLTHLLGQTFAEVGEKVRLYRAAWEKAGHAGRGTVSLMLHTFLGNDAQQVKEAVRKPMKGYLKSAVGLIKEAAWSFPTFKQRVDDGTFSADQLSPEEMDALLDHAFERYYATSGLFGTVDDALKVVEELHRIDVDELACLVDFGVDADRVLSHLPLLAELRARMHANADRGGSEPLGELLNAHPVTHFQCTPSMASMLVLDDQSRAGLTKLDVMLVGGEALPPALARQLTDNVRGTLTNVYGPTETTIWSTSQRVERGSDEITIGRPLANTEVFVLDAGGMLVPPGDEGELVIAGRGVARGYLGREELTRERFIPHPFRAGERAYRTGDLVSFDDQGVLHFHGRLDHQVKIRGYRIEIGEIEARLAEHASVRECAVVARADTPGDRRLVAYVVSRGPAAAPVELREHLQRNLPEYMLPQAFVFLGALPQTLNGKIDRKALPKPERESVPPAASTHEAAGTVLEETIAQIWREVLERSDVGITDNFFDLGGHSLLTIRVLGKLKSKVTRPISLVDLFRFPTIRSLAEFLDSKEDAGATLQGSVDRGSKRQQIRRAMMRQRG